MMLVTILIKHILYRLFTVYMAEHAPYTDTNTSASLIPCNYTVPENDNTS